MPCNDTKRYITHVRISHGSRLQGSAAMQGLMMLTYVSLLYTYIYIYIYIYGLMRAHLAIARIGKLQYLVSGL